VHNLAPGFGAPLGLDTQLFQGPILANVAIVPAGSNGGISVGISVFVTGRTDVILDINGYPLRKTARSSGSPSSARTTIFIAIRRDESTRNTAVSSEAGTRSRQQLCRNCTLLSIFPGKKCILNDLVLP
jgi:hypothetical protein